MPAPHRDHLLEKGQANGLAPLDSNSLVPEINLPELTSYSLILGADFDSFTTPLTGVGQEIILAADTLVKFKAIRHIAGASGTTTIELELNGIGTGDTLSWSFSDANNTIKTSIISLSVSENDILSFKVTSVETGGSDITVRVG